MTETLLNPHQVDFDLPETSYAPPDAWAVHFDLDDQTISVQYVTPIGFDSPEFGQLKTKSSNVTLRPSGVSSQLRFGQASIILAQQIVAPKSFDSSKFSNPSIINFHKNVYGVGFNAAIFDRPTIYNLRKYVLLNGRGIESNVFGTAYMQGGVRFVQPGGLHALRFGDLAVINTKADQKVQLTGIAAPTIPKPNVSPQILTVRGILGTQWGSPYVQRNPSPKGWNSEKYGTAWVSRSPRFYTVGIGELTEFGSAKIFDAKQTVTITGVIPGGIFGDIQIRNLNFKVAPGSIEAPPLSDWTKVDNTARYYPLKGFDTSLFGTASINNGTPSFAPDGFDSASFGNALVAERIRRINTPGFSLLSFGRPTVTKTPQLSPRSIAPLDLGQPTLTLYTRYIVSSGRMMMAMGEPSIGMAKRKLAVGGFNSMRLGDPVITHGQRELLAQGSNHSRYGNAHQVWFRVRSIAPASIYEDQKQYGHRLGGSQHIQAKGFDATLFGTRIIPESQSILASNFASSVFGTARLQKTREYLSVVGFATGGQQPADRWGKTTVYNSRQYIIQTYDVDSDLNPPKLQGWMSIINRNRTVRITGSNMALFGRALVRNNATLMQPGGIDARPLGTAWISHRVRPIRLEGMEPPYISGWTHLHNAAFVIKPKGFDTEKWGTAAAVNTRRYFPRIGNFESLAFGQPMISFKKRGLSIESRYSIGPIYIPIHKVDLYTRYVETLSNDFAQVGVPSLSIHRKVITPRWYLRDLFGDPSLRNVTPEVKTRGRNAEEFGQAAIRTQWRNVDTFGDNAQLFGKPIIADRNRKLNVNSFVAGAIGALRVRGTASPPLSTQYIFLNNVENRGEDSDDDTSVIKDGHGIGIPFDQVPRASLRTNVIRPQGFDAKLFGTADVYSNGILMENGIKLDKELGTPMVQLARRTISINEGINNLIAMGRPRLSPHTIYAVLEATEQAKRNHPQANLHAVNSDSGYRKPGEVFGRARVWIHNPYLNVQGIWPRNDYGTPRVELKRRYLEVKGIQAYRFGWHNIGDGTQEIKSQPNNLFTVFGRPGITLAKEKNVQLRPPGLSASLYGRPVVEFFHRTIKPSGYNTLAMGSSRGGTLYMPQSLHVGPRRPTIPVGTLMEKFGTTYIGLKVRDIQVQGFEATVIGYDPTQFKERMRVERGQGGAVIPAQTIKPVGFDALRSNASNVKYAVHYIRPDGNSDQFRKGAF
ncbi:phage protein [Acinetobacter sp. HA]|uniref:hypothetical protein n=1 Tax=Acinetobacter TaxID=469 RepID=UPI000263DEB3|nr:MULTISPECIES: hypothetical protein [Acinetobacter]EIM39986.1 phage protein [Acinetobacter sp. HA]MBB4836804.1 hypothetical protein [Acinetobacter schindleri]WBX36761.1 hypothetical protein MYA84_08440 [Acinetobacter schindleri]